jgi:hypothetical protein
VDSDSLLVRILAPVRPDPFGDFWVIIAVSARPCPGFVAAVDHGLPGGGGLRGQTRNPIDHVGDEAVAIKAVHHHHVQVVGTGVDPVTPRFQIGTWANGLCMLRPAR